MKRLRAEASPLKPLQDQLGSPGNDDHSHQSVSDNQSDGTGHGKPSDTRERSKSDDGILKRIVNLGTLS